ncbi:MAG: fumarate reductase/succinate dehydrogenase flavoprotein subunit [Candidatus Cloacimonetes bacterium]|nr:fumarate reductase/succinate dehydrogenase flavoprotein subunit [Candidatus Cloacimonadota bacterium]
MKLNSNVPKGKLKDKWTQYKFDMKLVNPANKRKYNIIVVGTGLAGASAAASYSELGYNVKVFCIQDSPRRAHSIAAQGGINAAKNYPNDGDSIYRLFYDTIKGGDYRSREANVYRLAEVSNNIIDQCVAQGVPFARDYDGTLSNRSFGGALVSRTFYARGQTGQQLHLGACGALMKEASKPNLEIFPRREMMELVIHEGKARGIVVRNLINGELESYTADMVVLASGGYGNIYFLSTNAMSTNSSAIWAAHKKGAFFANPCFVQIHPTCMPVHGEYQSKLTLMSESLRNDGRVWVPQKKGDKRHPNDIPENERDYYLENKYPTFGNLVPRDVASRNAKEQCDLGKGVGNTGLAVYLDFKEATKRIGLEAIKAKYGNLFDMYKQITGKDPYSEPMMIFPAIHYTMGGLWVDYNLMSNLPGLFVLGEANFSDHGANRLGASALMQGLADGYFVAPYTAGNYLAQVNNNELTTDHEVFQEAEKAAKDKIEKLLAIKGNRTVDDFHKELGKLLWDNCGIARNETDLKKALKEIPRIREEFWKNVLIPGTTDSFNQTLERAMRVADFLEMAELMIHDASDRKESCGCHLREESQTEEGEALRKDNEYSYVSAWEFKGVGKEPELHKEELTFEEVELTQRSYK